MSQAIIMIYTNIINFVLISLLEKDHSMIETRRLKNVVVFFQTILSLVLSRKNINIFLLLLLPSESYMEYRKY